MGGRTQSPEGIAQMWRHHEPIRHTIFQWGDIMDIMPAITTFIQTLGFPIACVCYLFYSQAKEREAHAAESKAWVEAIHNNTLAIQQLTDVIKNHYDK